jgi:hypothetical protein
MKRFRFFREGHFTFSGETTDPRKHLSGIVVGALPELDGGTRRRNFRLLLCGIKENSPLAYPCRGTLPRQAPNLGHKYFTRSAVECNKAK